MYGGVTKVIRMNVSAKKPTHNRKSRGIIKVTRIHFLGTVNVCDITVPTLVWLKHLQGLTCLSHDSDEFSVPGSDVSHPQ